MTRHQTQEEAINARLMKNANAYDSRLYYHWDSPTTPMLVFDRSQAEEVWHWRKENGHNEWRCVYPCKEGRESMCDYCWTGSQPYLYTGGQRCTCIHDEYRLNRFIRTRLGYTGILLLKNHVKKTKS